MTYTIKSIKGSETVKGTAADAVRAALAHDAEYQPAFGTTIEVRTAEAWWAWHDADYSRVGDDAEQRCAEWVSGESDKGPTALDLRDADELISTLRDEAEEHGDGAQVSLCERADEDQDARIAVLAQILDTRTETQS